MWEGPDVGSSAAVIHQGRHCDSGKTEGADRHTSTQAPCTLELRVALHTSIPMLLPSRKNLKAPMTSASDLATSSPHFHSGRVSGSQSLSDISSDEETKSEVRTQKNILESLQLVNLVLLTTKLMASKLLQYGAPKMLC